MKALLVGVNSKFIHSNLAIRYLRAYTKDLKYNYELREFTINDRVEKVFQEIMLERPSLILFSCYIWNIEFIERLSSLIKLTDENIEILYGGPEVTYDSENILRKLPGDYIISGEGEETYREFIEFKIKNDCNINQFEELPNEIKDIKGLCVKHKNNIYYAGDRELMNMNDIVFPYELDEDFSNKIVYYEASRGCPFRCKYCLSCTSRKVRFLDINRVKKELQYFIDKKVRLVKFVDRTFNCSEKFAMEIWDFIINQETNTSFHFEISADILTENEIKLLANAPVGRIQFEVGVQTTNNEILRNINRFVNFESIEEKVKEVQNYDNIKQHLDLIAGLPGEDLQSFIKSFNDVHKLKPEEIQLGFLKLLKGSPMREEAEEWGMKYSPYPPYEILKTNTISYDELVELKRVEEVVDKYYNSGKFNNILKYFLDMFDNAFEFYHRLGEFLYKKGYLNRNISGPHYYKIFLEFNNEELKNDNFLLSEIIKFDYLKFNKKKWMPEFLDRFTTKEEERIIKDYIRENNLQFEKNKFHIEKFKIDIIKFINDNIIVKEDKFLIFDEKDIENIVSLYCLPKI